MAQPSPLRDAVLKVLPAICWFRTGSGPKASDLENDLTTDGFTDYTTSGNGTYVNRVTLTRPDGTIINISPVPTSGNGSTTKYDVTSSIQLTLGSNPI